MRARPDLTRLERNLHSLDLMFLIGVQSSWIMTSASYVFAMLIIQLEALEDAQ
jgi:hypothetical protein